MQGLADGIKNNIPLVQSAVKDVSEVMRGGISQTPEFDYARMQGIIQVAISNSKGIVVIDRNSFKRGLTDMGVQFR